MIMVLPARGSVVGATVIAPAQTLCPTRNQRSMADKFERPLDSAKESRQIRTSRACPNHQRGCSCMCSFHVGLVRGKLAGYQGLYVARYWSGSGTWGCCNIASAKLRWRLSSAVMVVFLTSLRNIIRWCKESHSLFGP